MQIKFRCRAHHHTKALKEAAEMTAGHLAMQVVYHKQARNQRGRVIKKKGKNCVKRSK
jgi:hypothetical protein